MAPDTWEIIMGLTTGAEFTTWLCLNTLSRLVLRAHQCNYGNKTAGAMEKSGKYTHVAPVMPHNNGQCHILWMVVYLNL